MSPNRVGVYPFTWGRKQIQSPTHCVLWFLEYLAMDKSENPVILTVIHHRQSILDSTRSMRIWDIRINLRKIRCAYLKWIKLAQKSLRWWLSVNTVINFPFFWNSRHYLFKSIYSFQGTTCSLQLVNVVTWKCRRHCNITSATVDA
jgi:hypothetical protein